MGKINENKLNEQLIYITLNVIIYPQILQFLFVRITQNTYTTKIALIHTDSDKIDLCIYLLQPLTTA